jgi:hypothetical protein
LFSLRNESTSQSTASSRHYQLFCHSVKFT